MERRDITNKSELGRSIAMAQRMQQAVSGTSGGPHGLPDGAARGPGHESATTQGSQSGSTSHDGGNAPGSESEKPTAAEGGAGTLHDQPLQNPPSISESGQNTLKRSGPLGYVASAASAFEAAKDIMEALRNKHSNLANELEVTSASQNIPSITHPSPPSRCSCLKIPILVDDLFLCL